MVFHSGVSPVQDLLSNTYYNKSSKLLNVKCAPCEMLSELHSCNFICIWIIICRTYLPSPWKCHKGTTSLSVHYFVLSIGHTGWNMVGAKLRFPASVNTRPWEVTNSVIFILREWKLKYKRLGWGVISKLRWWFSMVSMSPDKFSECFLSLMKEDTHSHMPSSAQGWMPRRPEQ